ncbi:MAG TPA: Gfo/Idh/MocA family oxidoreductase [Armatimonadota bacterium]
MSILRIGIIGVGYMARKHHIPSLQQVEGAQIVATCDLREDRVLPGVNSYHDVREMLAHERLDVLYVLTPPGAHLEPVCLGLDHGCHVFCEMPPALEPWESAQMATFAREAKRSLMFGANRHFAPTYQRIKEIASSEPPKMTVLTKCRHGLHDLTDDFLQALETHYAQRHAMEGTPMFLGIAQFLEVAEWLNGPILDCQSTSSALRPAMQTNTQTVAYLQHEDGARSMITYDEFGPQPNEHVTVHSSASTYIVRGSMMQPNELLVWASDGHRTYPAPVDPQERGGFLNQTQQFLHHVRQETPLYPDGTQLARLVHLARRIDGSGWWKTRAAEPEAD